MYLLLDFESTDNVQHGLEDALFRDRAVLPGQHPAHDFHQSDVVERLPVGIDFSIPRTFIRHDFDGSNGRFDVLQYLGVQHFN